VAVAIRNQTVAAVVFAGAAIVRVGRYRLLKAAPERVARAIAQLAADHGAGHIVHEPTRAAERLLGATGLRREALTLAAAKEGVLGDPTTPHSALYDRLVGEHPELARFVRIQRAGPLVGATDWRRTVVLLAAALGIAYQRSSRSTSS
jgi:hypothetical protein